MNSGINQYERTREIEVLEFRAGGYSYGIDVTEIEEIIPYSKVTPVPNSHPYIEGIIIPREILITVLNVVDCLQLKSIEEEKKEMFVITSLQGLNIALHVDSVAGIHKFAISDILEPDEQVSTSVSNVVTGILDLGYKQIEIIDLKQLAININSNLSDMLK